MATSAVGAAILKYQSLAGLPAIYFGDAVTTDGVTQVYPPYVVLLDEGLEPEYNESLINVQETTDLTFMVYSNLLSEVDAICQKIKYNGFPPSMYSGFDFGTLPALDAPYKLNEIRRTSERRFVASVSGTGKQSQRVHGMELRYRVTIFLYGS